MKRFLKWAAIIVGCLLVVIIAALVLIPMFVDVAKYKPMLESKVTEATGRPFSVGDDLNLSLFSLGRRFVFRSASGQPGRILRKRFYQGEIL